MRLGTPVLVGRDLDGSKAVGFGTGLFGHAAAIAERRVRRYALLCTALLAGCNGDVQAFLVSPEPSPEHRTRVVAIHDAKGVEAHVFALDDRPDLDGTFSRDLGPDDRLLVYVMDYRESLERLDVNAGTLGAAGPDERSCAFAAPAIVRRAEATDGLATDWLTIVVGDVAADVVEHLVNDTKKCLSPNLCRRIVTDILELGDTGNVEVLLRRNDRFALVGTVGEFFYDVDDDSVSPKPEMRGLPSRTGLYTSDGTLWLGGNEGRIAYGQDETAMTVETIADVSEGIYALHVRATDDIYALAQDHEPSTLSRLLHFDGNEWSEITRRDLTNLRPKPDHAGIAESADGTIMVGDGSPFIWLVDVTDQSFVELQPEDTRTTSIGHHPKLGLIRGNNLGQVRYTTAPIENAWTNLPTVIGRTVEMIGSFGDVVLYGGANGSLAQHHEESAACDVQGIPAVDLETMAAFDDKFIVGGGNVDHQHPNRVAWVRFEAP